MPEDNKDHSKPTSDLLFSDGDTMLFAPPTKPEPQTFIAGKAPLKILIVDDNRDVHELTRLVFRKFDFEGHPIELISAYSGLEAKSFLQAHDDIAVILLDIVMESDDSGLQVVNYIRNVLLNNIIRIILRTGQPGAAPEEKVFLEYDINDYMSKSEVTSTKLLMAVVTALRSYRDISKAIDAQKAKQQAEQERQDAADASRAKSQFLAHMSHEIRTPMNGILGMSDVLLGTELSEEQRGYVEIIKGSGSALLTIINDILDFSKIEAGKLELDQKTFDLYQLIKEVRSIFSVEVDKKHLRFTTTITEGCPQFLLGDEVRIRQILINLLANAVKFTPDDGEIRLTLDSQKETRGIRIFFGIEDTGIGIPKDKQHKLFKAFSQADTSTTREYGGTGLGLEICKRLCKLMNGQINLISNEGKGSLFKFDILLTEPSTQYTKSIEENVNKPSNHPPEEVDILIVEDNIVNQKVASTILKKLGYPHEIVNNGKEALDAIDKKNYQIVLMDCQMPEMDGYEATRRIRDQEELKNLPVIAMTASATLGEQQMCRDAGMNDFIAKPVNIGTISSVLKRWH